MEALVQQTVSSDTANATPPGQGAAPPPTFPSVVIRPLDIDLILCPERTIED